MIKIGDTVINKVQKSVNGEITEIPVVRAGNDELLHLGYNTYYTVFDNAKFTDVTTSTGYLTLGMETGTHQNSVRSNIIKGWISSFDLPSAGTSNSREIRVRMKLDPAGWNYDGDSVCSNVEVVLSYTSHVIIDPVGPTEPVVTYTLALKRNNNALPGYPKTEMLAFRNASTMMVALYLNDNMIPTCRFSYGRLSPNHSEDIPFGTKPVMYANEDISADVHVNRYTEKVSVRFEAGSYKSTDFSSSYPNYVLYAPETVVTGSSGEGSLDTGFTYKSI